MGIMIRLRAEYEQTMKDQSIQNNSEPDISHRDFRPAKIQKSDWEICETFDPLGD